MREKLAVLAAAFGWTLTYNVVYEGGRFVIEYSWTYV